ncbi:MAG: c-type cytochrome [Coleofasciculaceae cyanobacterium SM2_3_26]|nr:c-type cytochrome [Coleofasciculaceae cyanobacterium SM2_3_26]
MKQRPWIDAIAILAVILTASLWLWILPQPASLAAEPTEPSPGAEIFQAQCAACHPQGGNLIRWGKTLKLKALKRNGMNSVEGIAAIVTHGKNNMSAFGDRLTAAEIQQVSSYVLEQAQQNWR